MNGLNLVQILGHVGGDPDYKETANGMEVSNFSVAISYGENTEWVRVVAFKGKAKLARDYLHKGSKVYVSGRLSTSTYEKEGVTVYSTSLVADNLIFLDSRRDNNESTPNMGHSQYDNAEPMLPEDDIPF